MSRLKNCIFPICHLIHDPSSPFILHSPWRVLLLLPHLVILLLHCTVFFVLLQFVLPSLHHSDVLAFSDVLIVYCLHLLSILWASCEWGISLHLDVYGDKINLNLSHKINLKVLPFLSSQNVLSLVTTVYSFDLPLIHQIKALTKTVNANVIINLSTVD